jgi:hypothetical protein
MMGLVKQTLRTEKSYSESYGTPAQQFGSNVPHASQEEELGQSQDRQACQQVQGRNVG